MLASTKNKIIKNNRNNNNNNNKVNLYFAVGANETHTGVRKSNRAKDSKIAYNIKIRILNRLEFK